MSEARPAGPFSHIQTATGASVPLYLIPFDKAGRCVGPKTLDHMKQAAASDAYSDIHVYSHGWNNVFKEAVEHYTEFFTEYFRLRAEQHIDDAAYKPLLVGIIWPSTALVSADEQAPRFAATAPVAERAAALHEDVAATTELAADLPDEDVPRFFELTDAERISREEALELARMLLPVFESEGADNEGIPQTVTPEKLVKAWEQAQGGNQSESDGSPGTIADDDAAADATLRSAGILQYLNPKNIVRIATVYQMKDRAGTVGAHGVGPMLKELLANTQKRVHLAGHSYGAKVMLAALSLVPQPRKIRSLLLMQAAVNAYCFAESIQEHGGRPGAYRPALERTERPVFTTFSSNDSPLTKFFHIALRRDGDLGEIRPAGGPPSRFAALGGFGPGGMAQGESKTVVMTGPPGRYDVSDQRIRLYALNGSDQMITGHGDVRNTFTEWAMINLVAGG